MGKAGEDGKGDDVFCSDIIEKGIFYKTEHTVAISDIAPVVPGHSLVIPRRHVLSILEMSDEEVLDFFEVVRKVNPVLLKLYGDRSNSYVMTAQIGEYSGMSVRHFHLHIIPRKKTDPFQEGTGRDIYAEIDKPKAHRLSEEEYSRYVQAMRKELKWGK